MANVHSVFSGQLQGAGSLRLEGKNSRFELAGNSSLSGLIEVAAGELFLTGSLSNSVVELLPGSRLTGNGVANQVMSTGAVIKPGPGVLRIREWLSMDSGSRLETKLGGPESAMIQTEFLDLAGSELVVHYEGGAVEQEFTIVSAQSAAFGSQLKDLPEGAWLVVDHLGGPSEFRLSYTGGAGADLVVERTGLFEPPTLRAGRNPGGGVRLEWPLTSMGYRLQRTPSLAPAGWTSTGLPATATNSTDHYVVDTTPGTGFFYQLVR